VLLACVAEGPGFDPLGRGKMKINIPNEKTGNRSNTYTQWNTMQSLK
jgi:hypothetical protein